MANKPNKGSKCTHVTTCINSCDRHDVRADREVLKEVRRSNKLLKTLVKRVANAETRLKVVEGTIKITSLGAICSSGVESMRSRSLKRHKPKHDVLQTVRVTFDLSVCMCPCLILCHLYSMLVQGCVYTSCVAPWH